MSFWQREHQPSSISTSEDPQDGSTERSVSRRGAPDRPGAMDRRRFIRPLSVSLVVSILSFSGLTRPAAAEGVDSLRAHLGFFSEKPKSLPLGLPMLSASAGSGTTSYTVAAPHSGTGVTLVLYSSRSFKVKVKQRKTSEGKKLDYKTWTGRKRSTRWGILSFDGLGTGGNAIRFEVERGRRKSKTTETYEVSVTRATTPGSDAALTALSLSKSSLTPAFDPGTTSYQAAVPYAVTGFDVTVRRKEAATAVRLRGTAADGSPLAVQDLNVSGLTVGRNTLDLTATAEDGNATVHYSLTVTRIAPSRDTKLTGIALAEGKAGFLGVTAEKSILRPTFDRSISSYEATVATTATTVTITISNPSNMSHTQSGTASDGSPLVVRNTGMSLTMNETTRRSVSFDGLQTGRNRIEIRVTAEDGVTTGTYEVTVTREKE